MADGKDFQNEMSHPGRKSLPELARQWSKAIERKKGLRLSAAHLDLLTSAGVNDLLQIEAARLLKENACREQRAPKNEMSIPGRKSLPELARQWSKAIERGKGMRLSAADLDQLTSAGVNDLLQSAAATILKEKATCRKSRELSTCIDGETIGLIGTGSKTARSGPLISQSSGMTSNESALDLLAHLQATLRTGGKP